MRDLTQGSVRGHLLAMALPITIGMFVQTLYLMVDLWFVSGIGKSPASPRRATPRCW
jgi:Na+-driven multidrug efflux pump